MISTVGGTLQENISFCDIIRATFPMGSMTGAPKKKVMELIDQYEQTKRGIFSGAVGYISPNGDFDFNVVIRSILYNTQSGYLSFLTGSAITFQSDPENEWDECLLKAEAMKNVFGR
jgi:para-aminobenzoate synthetase component I